MSGTSELPLGSSRPLPGSVADAIEATCKRLPFLFREARREAQQRCSTSEVMLQQVSPGE
jgi:hypothetical protein